MYYLLMINLLLINVGMIMLLLNYTLSKKKFKLRNKLVSFECGFDSMSKLRLPFSLHFYIITIIFLIFDVEISLIFPVILNFKVMFISKMNLFVWIIFILILGLYYEWKEGSLSWLTE
uniref:NADH-ubiquinone oxidoreductase chain 3 n=1 Tax=Melanips sp. ZJUH 20220003 TaxID=2943452 RepID=A0A9E8K0D3_9HYME|nr:NADH dehydrogenase subunit 3 [Melanips sp. ZJUH 20220003]